MARLNQPPDRPYTTPANNRTNVVGDNQPSNMSPPPLRSLSLGTSVQSHGDYNLPSSPPLRDTEQPSLSPADCRTLEKILHDVASPPASPSPLEQNVQLLSDSGCASTAGSSANEKCFTFVGGETTDTGYEDEDDSMELSEGEGGESISACNQKDELRCNGGRRPSTTRCVKAKRNEHERAPSLGTAEGDTLEDIMNIPGKRALPAHPLYLVRSDFDRQTVPLNRMHLSMEKVLEQERVEKERAEDEGGPSVSVPTYSELQFQAQDFEESELDGFDADSEETGSRLSLGVSGVPRRKIPQGKTSVSEGQTSLVASVERAEGITVQVPCTPIPTAHTPEPAQVKSTEDQGALETPFSKTLSYFKHYKGVEISPPKPRRNTALPQVLAEVAGDVADTKIKTADPEEDSPQLADRDACMSEATSALADLEVMAPLDDNIDEATAALPLCGGDQHSRVLRPIDASSERTEAVPDSAVVNAHKQIILYPQHPVFVNAIGMIPATMFWATAAPIVKYTGIAVELLIDKLRDTYL